MTLVVVSPHLDDAVFSLGEYLATCEPSRVLTVFAGWPMVDTPTAHDHACGFDSSTTAVQTRRVEDALAVASLGHVSTHLPFVDWQYGTERPTPESIAELVAMQLDDGDRLAVPLGYLHHPDHVLTAQACGLLADRVDIVYAEQPYWTNCGLDDGTFPSVDDLGAQHGIIGAGVAKRVALGFYRSQQHVFYVGHLLRPETYWMVAR